MRKIDTPRLKEKVKKIRAFCEAILDAQEKCLPTYQRFL